MKLALAFYIAAAVAGPVPAERAGHRLGGAEADARIAVHILRAAVLREGRVVFSDGQEGPRTQRVRRANRVTHEFE